MGTQTDRLPIKLLEFSSKTVLNTILLTKSTRRLETKSPVKQLKLKGKTIHIDGRENFPSSKKPTYRKFNITGIAQFIKAKNMMNKERHRKEASRSKKLIVSVEENMLVKGVKKRRKPSAAVVFQNTLIEKFLRKV